MTDKPIIALLYDFDKTLCTTDMEDYAFIPALGYTPAQFWDKANTFGRDNRMDGLLAYMYTMIAECRAQGKRLDRDFLVQCGHSMELFPGVREWFGRINAFGEEQGVTIEHYVISSGLREIIEGSGIAHEFREIYACEFFYNAEGLAAWPKLDVNFTNKTQFVYRINKGVLDVSDDKTLNDSMPDDSKRIPFTNMIYVGDGLSDVPCMKMMRAYGGQAIAVYQAGNRAGVEDLLSKGRVDFIFPADYREGTGLDSTVKNIIRKMAISFYTFQTLSYTIDVYRREVKTEHNIIDFGAYVVMFPQLIAGPIVKYRDVSAQLHVYKHRYSLQQIEEGMTLFTFGLAKKVLLADAVGALWTDIIGIADSPSTTFVGLANASTPLVWLGVIAYSLQLYFDFSGYSLMAIGMGKMLGFDFPQNFNFPYISRSITEFWRRWHMTLSGWFREYVYIPLGGNRKGLKRQIFNLFVVELLTGIWHGADWNFICWGLYYFVLLAIEKLFLLKYLEKGRIWPHIYTMFLVVVGWAMFVGNEAGVGFGLLFRKLFLPSGGASPVYFLRNYGVLLAVSILCCTPLIEKLWNALRKHTVTRVAAVLVLLVLSTAYVVGSTNSPFLYFNF